MTPTTHHTLYSRVLGPPEADAVVLLPGFTASHRMWSQGLLALSAQHRLVLVDPLGFGRSPKPDIAYTLDQHLAALDATLSQLGIKQARIIGYSMGGLLALAYAARLPERVTRLTLIALPCYRSEQEALATVAGSSWLNRLLALNTPLAETACRTMCQFRPIFTALAPVLAGDVPAVVARDSLLHTWTSYSRTLQHVIFEAQPQAWLGMCQAPLLMLHGVHDRLAPLANLLAMVPSSLRARLVTIAAGHHLPFTHDAAVTAFISRFCAA